MKLRRLALTAFFTGMLVGGAGAQQADRGLYEDGAPSQGSRITDAPGDENAVYRGLPDPAMREDDTGQQQSETVVPSPQTQGNTQGQDGATARLATRPGVDEGAQQQPTPQDLGTGGDTRESVVPGGAYGDTGDRTMAPQGDVQGRGRQQRGENR